MSARNELGWGVFHEDTGKCVGTYVDKNEAEEAATERGRKYFVDALTEKDVAMGDR